MVGLKRTPLFPLYEEYGAKTINFGGWDLPVQFTSIKEEHEAVRTNAGLFDVSHMGEIAVKGDNSFAFLQKMMTNDISKLEIGGAMYSAMCYENGGTVDDLIIYHTGPKEYLLVVNAANTDKDFEWLAANLDLNVEIKNRSNVIAQLALQGPRANDILQEVVNVDLKEIRFFRFKSNVRINNVNALVSRTGYTGEDGFEIYVSQADAKKVWRDLIEVGKGYGLQPIGLGARDTLRLESKLALYGQELSPEITPLEAGLGFIVKLAKSSDFIGKEALKRQKDEGIKRKIVGIEMSERGIPRHGYEVYAENEKIGHITSGSHSPTLNQAIGLALLNIDYTKVGTEVDVQIRPSKRAKAKVVATPFYKQSN